MLKLPVHSLVSEMFVLGQTHFHAKEAKNIPMTTKNLGAVAKKVAQIESRCIILDLAMTSVSAARLLALATSLSTKYAIQGRGIISETHRTKLAAAVHDMEARLHDELKSRLFLSVLPSVASRYEQAEPLFGVDVHIKFPNAQFEIDEAGKCFALDRATASVFHLMRVMEIGLRATAACLGSNLMASTNPNWSQILRSMANEMASKKSARSWGGQDEEFFQEVYVTLDAVRNVWRNATMHVDQKYTLEEAQHIFGAVRGFMTKLASRLDEQGLPLA